MIHMDLERSRLSPLPPIPFLNSPRRKNQNGNERQGERAGRAVLRALGGIQSIGTQSERTWRVQATTHAERAKSGVLFEMGSNFLIQ